MKDKRYILIILFVLILFSSYSCRKEQSPQWEETVVNEAVYAMDTSIILQTIINENMDDNTFMEIGIFDFEPLGYPVTWRQEDYRLVAETFYQYVVGERIENWELIEISFTLNCMNAEDGLQKGWFIVLSNAYEFEEDGTPFRRTREIIIEPTANNISFFEVKHHLVSRYSELPEWPVLKIEEIRIPAEEALQIADLAGGKAFRYEYYQNDCDINIDNVANSIHKGWYVEFGSFPEIEFQVEVNDKTGDYEILDNAFTRDQ